MYNVRHCLLSPGSHIRIVTPAFPSAGYVPRRTSRATRLLAELGYRVSFSEFSLTVDDDGISSSRSEQRASDINSAFADDSVDAVMCSLGGSVSQDLLPHLDTELIGKNPKVFLGHSDNVYISSFILTRCSLASYYGTCLLTQFGESPTILPETLDWFIRITTVEGPTTLGPTRTRRTRQRFDWFDPSDEPKERPRDLEAGWQWVREGSGRGQLIGGELSLIPDLLGIMDGYLEAALLFWDLGVHHEVGHVERLFDRLAQRINGLKVEGMIVASNPSYAVEQWADYVGKLIGRHFPDSRFPVVVGGECGHYDPVWTLPFGEVCHLDSASGLTCRPHQGEV